MTNIQPHNLSVLFKPQEGPQIHTLESSPNTALLTLHVPNDLAWFEGHFPDQSVLPGVVQIDWAGKLSRSLFVGTSAFGRLTNVKFKTMVLPDTTLSLELTHRPEKGSVKFHFFNDAHSFSLGSLQFRPL